eukprot:jgi/Mesen1/10109/ME000075S09616
MTSKLETSSITGNKSAVVDQETLSLSVRSQDGTDLVFRLKPKTKFRKQKCVRPNWKLGPQLSTGPSDRSSAPTGGGIATGILRTCRFPGLVEQPCNGPPPVAPPVASAKQ